MTWLVREATPDDAAQIAEIKIAAWNHAYSHILPPEILNIDEVRETAKWKSRLAVQQNCIVGEVNDKVAGYITHGRSEVMKFPTDEQIYSLYIHPTSHRKGLGRELIRRVAEHYDARGVKRLIVCVFKENPPAIKFYRALGAEYLADTTYTIDGVDYPDEVYVWRDLDKLIARP